MARWLVDGNNVMGSRPDGWWHDRAAGMARLAQEIAEWCWSHEDEVVLIFDGRQRPSVTSLAGGNLSIRFAGRTARDAADDEIVGLAEPGDLVVTADRTLIERLTDGVTVIGPRAFLYRIAPGT